MYNVLSGRKPQNMDNTKTIALLQKILRKVPLCIEDESQDQSMKDYVEGWNFISRAIRNTITSEINKL